MPPSRLALPLGVLPLRLALPLGALLALSVPRTCAARPARRSSAESVSAWLDRFLPDEAAHVGSSAEAHADPIVSDFDRWLQEKAPRSRAEALGVNDMELHQRIVGEFCLQLVAAGSGTGSAGVEPCRWRDFYALLRRARGEFSKQWEPNAPIAISLADLREHGASVKDCIELSKPPSAQEFFGLVVSNKPAIIRGVAKRWPALKRWTNAYLANGVGKAPVVVSASPHGNYDTPEPASLWRSSGVKDMSGVVDTKSTAYLDYIVARPGHLNMNFSDFVALMQARASGAAREGDNVVQSGALYLEYFPLSALHQHRDRESGVDLVADLKFLDGLDFAGFLSAYYRLIWIGRETTGSLHFDRNENLMVMARGSKTFKLVPPHLSSSVYGGEPIRSASFKVEHRRGGRNPLHFSREAGSVANQYLSIHSYSPVNISDPRITREFPRFKKVKREGFPLHCRVEEGDAIYVPSNWWHEVTSHPDPEGKTIGVNIFYESMYYTPGYNVTSPAFIQRRYYQHLKSRDAGGLGLLKPCESEFLCFDDGAADLNAARIRRLMKAHSITKNKEKSKKTAKEARQTEL